MKKTFFFLLGLFFSLCVPVIAFAEDVLIFHFEQRDGRLYLDGSENSVVMENDPNFSVVEFSLRPTSGKYRIDLLDITGASPVSYWFSLTDGKSSYEMPHFGIVKAFKIYNADTQQLLFEGSLEKFVRCNANGMCEFEKGENFNTCLSDCISGQFSEETRRLLKANGDIVRDSKTGEVLLQGVSRISPAVGGTPVSVSQGSGMVAITVFGIAFLLIVGGVLMLFLLKRRNRRYGL